VPERRQDGPVHWQACTDRSKLRQAPVDEPFVAEQNKKSVPAQGFA
jgi:type IV secretory pathway VirD2 relaxase